MARDEFCKQCNCYDGCAFLSRNLRDKCNIAQDFDDGYEQGYNDAVDKACRWLEENSPMRFDDVQNYVERFKQVMQDGK